MATADARGSTSSVNLQLAKTRRRLSAEQQIQIARQLDFHEGAPFLDVVGLNRPIPLVVGRDVMRPMSSKVLAEWLWVNSAVLRDRTVFDVGTGCGVQAIVSALAGARKVVAGDVSPAAMSCATENVRRLEMGDSVWIRDSDVLSGFPHEDLADVIIFAQPFFGDDPIPERPVSSGMLDPGILVPRFLSDAKALLKPDGFLLMMAWSFAGITNDPRTHCQNAGYTCESVGGERISGGCQQGSIEILALQPVGAKKRLPLVDGGTAGGPWRASER